MINLGRAILTSYGYYFSSSSVEVRFFNRCLRRQISSWLVFACGIILITGQLFFKEILWCKFTIYHSALLWIVDKRVRDDQPTLLSVSWFFWKCFQFYFGAWQLSLLFLRRLSLLYPVFFCCGNRCWTSLSHWTQIWCLLAFSNDE